MNNISRSFSFGLGLCVVGGLLPLPGNSPEHVTRFFETHCLGCHNPEKEKGAFIINPLLENPSITDPGNAFDWELILDVLNLGEMPPEQEPRPDPEELVATTRWITAQLEAFHSRKESSAPTHLRRLNRQEYQNTIRDLLGIEYIPGDGFPHDETVEGFDNVGQALRVSATLIEQYLIAAEDITRRAIVAGPKPETVTIFAADDTLECDPSLGIKRDGGIELVSGREFRSRAFSKQAVAYEGLYRVRMRVDPFRAQGEPVRVNVRAGLATNGPTSLKTVDVFSIDEPTTLEVTVPLKPGEAIHVSYPDGPQFPNNGQVARANYQGPGIFIHSIETVGPLIEEWPLPGHQALFAPARGKRDLEGAEAILTTFARRAYRRPPTPLERDLLLSTYKQETRFGAGFEEAIRVAVQVALCSPSFLFLNLPPVEMEADQLDPFTLATRLSYFLWSSTPDETLLASAESGMLASDPEELVRQTERMLNDPRADAFIFNFVGQWLKMREVGSMKPDKRFYPDYDGALGAAMRRETEAFIAYLLRENESIFNVLDSNFTLLNERLAQHYGIPGVEGREFRKVALDPSLQRGGVLGHASVMMITSNGTHSQPVVRGVYVLDNLLGTPPPPPPPDVEPIEPDTRGTTTIVEQMMRHRDVPTCYDCHQKIDPFGLALESFDPIGKLRSNYLLPAPGGKTRPGPEVTTTATAADGTLITGPNDLRAYLMGRKEQFAHNLTEKLLIYGTGRKLNFDDKQEVLDIVAEVEEGHSGFRTLVQRVIQSKAFRRM